MLIWLFLVEVTIFSYITPLHRVVKSLFGRALAPPWSSFTVDLSSNELVWTASL
jgi:hypothetical protein